MTLIQTRRHFIKSNLKTSTSNVMNNRSHSITCRYCRQEGHMVRDCPSKPASDNTCRYCKQEGHMIRDCPSKPARREPGDNTCRYCKQEGHMIRDCPSKPTRREPGDNTCRYCKQEGHMIRDCPSKPARRDYNNKPPQNRPVAPVTISVAEMDWPSLPSTVPVDDNNDNDDNNGNDNAAVTQKGCWGDQDLVGLIQKFPKKESAMKKEKAEKWEILTPIA